ncbi:MAG: glycosyltransferase family 4 protein [Bacteroidales bacterium]|nr:glycosyltransferase family 4 protein [Bacteroidales bacterium]
MKLIYCIADVYNPGGMERVLLNKLRWWVARGDCELMVVTTDQNGRPPFYAFPPEVRMVDLDVNYKADNGRNPVAKILSYFHKRRMHRQRLTTLLMKEKADIVVSLYPSESSFIPKIEDGSKKVLELHFNKYFRLQYNRGGLLGLADRFRTRQDERIVRRFDRFVVLTREDAGYWGALPNLAVIPNAALNIPDVQHKPGSHRVIAVGRLDYQKGFDRLLEAWVLIPSALREKWRLDIFGQGEWEQMLKEKCVTLGIAGSARINKPTNAIFEEYAASDFLVMSSHYEGFPMVMIEAMACGLPVVCFDFLCGPRDIIRPGENGLMVKEGDIPALAAAMQRVMEDPELLDSLSRGAKEISQTYAEAAVMAQWEACFNELIRG